MCRKLLTLAQEVKYLNENLEEKLDQHKVYYQTNSKVRLVSLVF